MLKLIQLCTLLQENSFAVYGFVSGSMQ
uniref:Uncharacterized protein n=1 Tax=Anguilla anguilla TaxID=7936 RepID=A0A0E9TQ41_ANGAN